MAFTIRDMSDLTRLLGEHPEWREELRRLVLTDELLSLPDIVREIADDLRRLTERVDRLTERVDQLTERVDRLAFAQVRTEERLASLVGHFETLLVSHQRMVDDIGGMKGTLLELEYRSRAAAYFGKLLRKGKVVDTNDVWDSLEASLTAGEVDDVLLADLFMQGAVRGSAEPKEVFLVIEVSFVVDRFDVERARRRADLLRRAGYPAVAVAAGERVTAGAKEAAAEERVALVERQTPFFWEDALRGLAA